MLGKSNTRLCQVGLQFCVTYFSGCISLLIVLIVVNKNIPNLHLFTGSMIELIGTVGKVICVHNQCDIQSEPTRPFVLTAMWLLNHIWFIQVEQQWESSETSGYTVLPRILCPKRDWRFWHYFEMALLKNLITVVRPLCCKP